MLSIGNIDKLILYAALILVVQISIVFLPDLLSETFEESRIKFIWDGSLFKEIFGFAGWNMWGCLAHILYTQGLNILLNMFSDLLSMQQEVLQPRFKVPFSSFLQTSRWL